MVFNLQPKPLYFIIISRTVKKMEEKFLREKPHLNVGTIGQDHPGKTSLPAAFTHVPQLKGWEKKEEKVEDIDNAAEEKARGITIALHHSEYETDKRHYAHIDAPGHA